MVTALTLVGSEPGIYAPYLVSVEDNRDYMVQPFLLFVGKNAQEQLSI